MIQNSNEAEKEMNQITIRDIARICGVGVATVSRAMNDHPDINAATKKRVMEVVHEYGFVPNISARNLKLACQRNIAILVKGMSNPFFMRMLGIMEEDIHNRKYYMEVRHIDEKTDEAEVAIDLLKEKKLRGFIFLGGLTNHSPEKLREIGIPFVLSTISTETDSMDFSSVSVDDTRESYKIIDYLIKKGHRRIAFMGAREKDTSISALRLEGYKKALSDNGIKFDPDLVWYSEDIEDIYSMKNGYKMMSDKLNGKEKPDFTAIFAIADTMAIGAIRALNDAGFSVPNDVSVAGFDGIEMGSFMIPSLTTIAQPFEQMAHQTVDILFSEIESHEAPRKVKMEATLYEGESVR